MRIFKTRQSFDRHSLKRLSCKSMCSKAMVLSKSICVSGYAVAAVVLFGSQVLYAQTASGTRGLPQMGTSVEEKVQFSSFVEAYRHGMGGLRASRMDIAIPALEYAAEGNLLGAQIWLARLYADGTHGAPIDPAKSFQYYQKIADRLSEASTHSPYARIASEAFLAVAGSYHKGLSELGLKQNSEEAFRLYHHAATYFQDAKAQFYVAQMYLHGDGVKKDATVAASWLVNSARKNHAPAQAFLGEMLWNGQDIKAQKAKGFALVKLALLNASEQDKIWIVSLHDRIDVAAQSDLKQNASKLVSHWQERFGASKLAASKANTLVSSSGASVTTSETAETANSEISTLPAGFGLSQENDQSKAGMPYMGQMTNDLNGFRQVGAEGQTGR